MATRKDRISLGFDVVTNKLNELKTLVDSGSVGTASSQQIARYSVSTTTGNFTAATTVPFNTEDIANSITTNSSGEITVNDTGNYIVLADITIDESSGSNRTEFGSVMQLNNSDISGTERRHYSRQATQGAQSSTISVSLSLTSGDVIRVRSRQVSGSNSGEFLGNGCSISFVKLTGEKGDKGDTGGIATTDYATSTVGGTVKMRIDGTDLYITNDGSDA